jgi:glycosyltransferase involved in cell wall biosynthesis
MLKNKVSIIIPIYNESKYIKDLIVKIKSIKLSKLNCKKEIIIVNDGSTDQTKNILSKIKGIVVLNQKNLGKGRAVQNGIKKAKGNLILVQDGDLEYNPSDYPKLLKPFTKKKRISVFGNRYYLKKRFNKNFFNDMHPGQKFGPYLMNKILQLLFLILYKKNISDLLTGYKVYEKDFFNRNKIQTNGFETDHEISAKLVKQNYSILEVPINYNPRSYQDGKKIKLIDGFKAILTLLKFK